MKVCFVTNEYPGFGLRGGFGVLTKDLAEGLAKIGVETCVLVPKSTKAPQKEVEIINGVKIHAVPNKTPLKFLNLKKYKLADVDIFHSEEILVDSYCAQLANPNAEHIVTFQDPPYFHEIIGLNKLRKQSNLFLNTFLWFKFRLRHCLLKHTLKKMHSLYSEAHFLIDKAKQMYDIKGEIYYLPNPVKVPKTRILKSKNPSVVFLARWDVQKRPWIFLELAEKFPDVEFIALGSGQEDNDLDSTLREKHKNVPNLKMPGYVSVNEKNKILSKSWIMINTSVREGLPIAFLEALLHECALLSYVNPDGLPERFGHWAKDEDFENGLMQLLKRRKWNKLGRAGRKHVKDVYEFNKVMKQHKTIYEQLMSAD
ncbi:MAG: glycosyltransferase family 4 protein [Candidatus Altiarchaeota archaeon]|nr:glycosyltransferase family 4 protein [Candidatus Altiarchaeota archaeon]